MALRVSLFLCPKTTIGYLIITVIEGNMPFSLKNKKSHLEAKREVLIVMIVIIIFVFAQKRK